MFLLYSLFLTLCLVVSAYLFFSSNFLRGVSVPACFFILAVIVPLNPVCDFLCVSVPVVACISLHLYLPRLPSGLSYFPMSSLHALALKLHTYCSLSGSNNQTLTHLCLTVFDGSFFPTLFYSLSSITYIWLKLAHLDSEPTSSCQPASRIFSYL